MFDSLGHARRLLEAWRRDYNHARTRSTHAGLPPAAACERPPKLRPAPPLARSHRSPRAAMTRFGLLPRTRPPRGPRHGRSTLRIIRLLEQTIAAALITIDAEVQRIT